MENRRATLFYLKKKKIQGPHCKNGENKRVWDNGDTE